MMPHVNTIDDVKAEIKKVITPQIFIHLNYGNLLLEFYQADYPVPEDLNLQDWASSKTSNLPVDWTPNNEEYILRIYKSYHNFMDYLEQDTKLKEYRHFAQLLADESLLTPRGIVFMVLDISEKNEVTVRSPPYGYDIEKHDKCDIGILLHDWRGIWEPIFYVENSSATATQREEHKSEIRFQQALEAEWAPILRKRVNEFRIRCATSGKAMFTSQQGINSDAILSPNQVITKLGKKAYPVGIVKDAYNHSVAITLRLPKNRNLISIPIVDDGNLRYMWLKIHLDWDDFTPAPADDVYSFFKNVVATEFPNYPGYQIIRKVTSAGEGGLLKAFQLRNGIYIPVGQPKSEVEIAELPTVSESEREWIINKRIYFDEENQSQQPEKLLLAEQRDMDEIYQHLRYTFGNWISSSPEEDMRARIEKIIFRKDLPLFEKRKRLFILLGNDIQSWFYTDGYKRQEITSLLRIDCILRAEANCSGRCVWRQTTDRVQKGKCLLHSPREVNIGGRKVNAVQLFVLRIIDELLRFPEKRKQLMEKEVSALVTLKDAVIIGKEKDQYIVPENTSAWFNLLRMDWAAEQKEQPLFFEEMSGKPPSADVVVPPRTAIAPSGPEPVQKQRTFKIAAASAPPAQAQLAPAPLPSAPLPSAPAPSASAQAPLPSAQKQRVFKIASAKPVEEAKEQELKPDSAPEPELAPELEQELPSTSVQQPEESKEKLATVEERENEEEKKENEPPLFEFENENENEEQKVEPEPEPVPEPAPQPVESKKRVFKIATQQPSVAQQPSAQQPSAQQQPSVAPSKTKTLMTIAKTLGNLHTADTQLEDTLGSMEGNRQQYDISFPVEEEELAKLDSQFKTLKIRPSGLSAVPGANFEENQQTLARLMREAELEEMASKIRTEGYESLETPTEESKNESASKLSD